MVDKNNDGFISKSEFQKMAKNLSKEQVPGTIPSNPSKTNYKLFILYRTDEAFT